MSGYFDYKGLEELSKGKGLTQIQYVFNILISELADHLKLEPIYQNILIELIENENFSKGENLSILDFGVRRVVQNNNLIIKINLINTKWFAFLLLREAYYSFIPIDVSELVKICINQIIENDLKRIPRYLEWKKLIRKSLLDRQFLHSQFDKLQKFFKIEANEPLESAIQFFFREIRENISLSQDGNLDHFYDLIFEKYTYQTSRTLFNSEIIETVRLLAKLFYENKLYLHLSDYQDLFKKSKENQQINSDLSLRKFIESLQWINKCSSIAPSYDIFYNLLDLNVILAVIYFNPLLEKNKIRLILEEWPFYLSLKFSENSFKAEISLIFIIPKLYFKDLLTYLNILEESGYIIKVDLYHYFKKKSLINLNYFTELSNIKKVIDPSNIQYEKKYEIETNINWDPTISSSIPLSLFEFKIIDRVKNLSVVGLTFDKRIETLNAIKEDIENELSKNRIFNQKFKKYFDKILNSNKLKQQFLKFLEKNKNKGFFYTYYQLSHILDYINLIRDILHKHPDITNKYQLQMLLNTSLISNNIEEYQLIRNKDVKNTIIRELLPLRFRSIKTFREEVEKVQSFYNVLDVCYNFKILHLYKIKKIINEPSLAKKIHQKRVKRYYDIFKSLRSYKITNEKIESTIEAFLKHEPPLLKPFLINTILTSTFAKYYIELILKEKPDVNKGLTKLRSIFPKIFISRITEAATNRILIYVSTYFLNINEKRLFFSILYSFFGDSIISIKRYFWRGVTRLHKHELGDFYDFKEKRFFYSEDFFKQLLIYTQKIFGEKLEWPKYPLNKNVMGLFWPNKQNIDTLIMTVKNRISYEDSTINLRELFELSNFYKNLETHLIDQSKFLNIKTKQFFKRYVKSIKFIPALQQFGFSQYYLYFRPFLYKSSTFEIDFRIFFINSFQNIKYPACIEPNPAIFIEYIFPFRNPNKTYLNWLTKSKKNVSEYCLFYKKKIYEIIHFNRNLTKEGWSYSSLSFKSFMQNVLFNPIYDPKITGLREFDLSEILESNILGYDTKEYQALTNIYNTQSLDIKSYLGTRNYTIINNITELLNNKLIFPYISLKNLDFQDKISIILPETKQEFNEKIIKIFSFFNMSRIYEIEGEFFIYGFEKEKSFENGLLIEIWFPKCELDEFFNVFDLLFQYFEINHYIVLTDLVNGKTLLKSVYGNLDFLKEYNPLLNLKWNDNDKIWMNHKLFNEKFEPIYPNLISKEKK
ncbi:MAG: hypothetical protein ACFE9I_05345 [Candidatus Hermodarchaeota archaeon]